MKKMKYIIECIKWYSKNRFTTNKDYEILFKELCIYIAEGLQEWTGKTYVGISKSKEDIWKYQTFFVALYELINTLSNHKENLIFLEKQFINNIKYNGKIYRYLGHGDLKNTNIRIRPSYNDIFVSWSKEKGNTYLETKLYGKITRLYGVISADNYGIDIEKLQKFYNNYFDERIYIAKGQEREVVYPTIKKDIYYIEYI